jgi:hypothetical protein
MNPMVVIMKYYAYSADQKLIVRIVLKLKENNNNWYEMLLNEERCHTFQDKRV